ncbi:uncharacterized protein Tco025E_06612 [Trypanosoma conorhini]|uniref:Uncharacterized protein n=1 Tax=Trypanosoma conorhini TaxID=83891 RepID=A0A422P280_9TRYP|nr:uncharacterized protein Tco025E_06612 [Trypanosoma conorhini]RNF11799.1 hypothetical protein Tco025E_06612 [Trypanosoma conorhini]
MRLPEPQQARGPSRRRASRRTTPQRPACTASAAGDGNDAPPRGGAPGHERPLCRALVIGDRGSFSQPIRWGRACTTTAPGARAILLAMGAGEDKASRGGGCESCAALGPRRARGEAPE